MKRDWIQNQTKESRQLFCSGGRKATDDEQNRGIVSDEGLVLINGVNKLISDDDLVTNGTIVW